MDELNAFVKEALGRGIPRPEIRTALIGAGWADDEVRDALSRFCEAAFPIPVPRPRQSGSARDAFLYLVTFFTLYVCAFSLGGLAFGLIDRFLPDTLTRYPYRGDFSAMRWAIASLIVAFPVYFGLMRKHLADYARDPERRTSAVRRWLTYLTLFVAATVVLGELVALISGALAGELAVRFVAQTLVVLFIAGVVFAYYLLDMKAPDAVEAR